MNKYEIIFVWCYIGLLIFAYYSIWPTEKRIVEYCADKNYIYTPENTSPKFPVGTEKYQHKIDLEFKFKNEFYLAQFNACEKEIIEDNEIFLSKYANETRLNQISTNYILRYLRNL